MKDVMGGTFFIPRITPVPLFHLVLTVLRYRKPTTIRLNLAAARPASSVTWAVLPACQGLERRHEPLPSTSAF